MRNYLIKLSLILVTLFPEFIYSQSLTFSGQVLSALDNSPIPHVHIAIPGKPIGTISDLGGYFEFTVSKKELVDNQLMISSVGYESLVLDGSYPWNKTIRLLPLINELEEVVISADKLEISPKKLVESALKTASKLDKDHLITLDIEQIAHHNGTLTKYYYNKEVELSRKMTATWGMEIPKGIIEYEHDTGSLPVTSFILNPEKVLIPDIYTTPKLKKGKGKYSFEFTDLTEVKGIEAFEVTVLQQSALTTRSSLVRNDYKFFFSTENLDLLKFERKEQIKYGEKLNDIHTLEHSIVYYNPSNENDPLVSISVEFNQFINRYSHDGEIIEWENKRELTLGHRGNPYTPYDTLADEKKYISVKDAIEKNSDGEKMYLYIFWNDSFNTIHENRETLYELLEKYSSEDLEISCIGSTKTKRNWKYQASSYPFFSHYYTENPQILQANSEANVQLFNKKTFLIGRKSVSDTILKIIHETKI